MSHSAGDNSSYTAEEGFDMEFRSYPDDAWYSVKVLLEGEMGEKLRVKYDGFAEEHDNVFLAEDYNSEDELYDFIRRFRKVSAQLQDADCFNVVKGMRVCASDSYTDDDRRFYDAILEDVLHKEHTYEKGQEECECTFMLYWLHGPNRETVTVKGVADICLLQESELQPKLASFMEIAMQKTEKALSISVSGICTNDLAVAWHKEKNGSPMFKQKQSFAERLGKFARQSLTEVWPYEGVKEVNCDRQDADVGRDKNLYIILVQNLEKELSSAMVSEFIHKQTSLTTQVYIFPSLPWEPYANGLIMLKSKKDLEQLFGFLKNPNHFVVSSNGRPWVATEKMSMHEHWTSMVESPNKLLNRRGSGVSNELKVVCSGSEEYKKAKKLRDLFLQFINHQKGLYERLHVEERNIQ